MTVTHRQLKYLSQEQIDSFYLDGYLHPYYPSAFRLTRRFLRVPVTSAFQTSSQKRMSTSCSDGPRSCSTNLT